VGPHKPGAWSRFKTRMKKGADFGQNEVAPRAAGFAPQAGNAAGVGSLAATLGTAQHSGVHLDASQIPAVGGEMMGNLADTSAELGTSITAGALSGGVGVLKAGLGAKGFVGGARNMHAASSMGGKLLAGKEMVDGALTWATRSAARPGPSPRPCSAPPASPLALTSSPRPSTR